MEEEKALVNKIYMYLVQQERELKNKEDILSKRLKDKYWKCDSKYLNNEIGQAKIQLEYIDYIKYLLKKRLDFFEGKEIKNAENFELKM